MAYWLRSSVVSVLNSLISVPLGTAQLYDIKLIFGQRVARLWLAILAPTGVPGIALPPGDAKHPKGGFIN
ncbi:uncharacterized protein VTP21DRAFT_779 [Calcarisporiella thermophila]|uniref:uncharacterized protein n=1 Tax=Calcarisporiella thermophila TaxID=911321 RepID=UPI003744289B